MIKCAGCGVNLQSDFPDKEGYTKDLNNKYCERCFNIIHYLFSSSNFFINSTSFSTPSIGIAL